MTNSTTGQFDDEEKGIRSRSPILTPTGADSLLHSSSHSSHRPTVSSEAYCIHEGQDTDVAHHHHDGAGHAPGWVRAVYFIPLLCFLIYFAVDSFTTRRFLHWTERLFEWVGNHVITGPLVYFAVVVIFAHLCIPESFLTIGGGYIFSHAHGPLIGILVCFFTTFFGLLLGSFSTFLIARHLIQETVQRWAHKYTVLRAIDHLLEDQGKKMVFLLRLSPIVPFNVFNYLMGVTMVSLTDFLWGSFGMVPWVLVCCYVGSAVSSMSDVFTAHHSKSYRVMLYIGYTVGGITTATIVYLISVYTKRAFREAMEQGGRNTPGQQQMVEEKEEDGDPDIQTL